ncbi:hypothetical protein [Zunongwangia endophytica]|uniref:Phosphatidate cytidylyltransferase n=1 Tax=Zunongwangia endophytica TaxID=1808945 RepID=A0ABV8HAD8_9FLAO|nr:hypothetical protein [Zunongwangia endophytica]MDN3596658.1 hypothetical protein [Zunongwangia endophytica]
MKKGIKSFLTGKGLLLSGIVLVSIGSFLAYNQNDEINFFAYLFLFIGFIYLVIFSYFKLKALD